MNSSHPTIVIVAYNRIHSLERLLASIANANYGDDKPQLIISIDYSENFQSQIKTVCENFEWTGTKKIIEQTENLGLKAHIFYCANLTLEYDSVIILEDDLFVSPAFYNYSQKALQACEGQSDVAGIALYNNSYNESVALPFAPMQSNGAFYLMQVPCSWGQIWTKSQWSNFMKWYLDSYSEANVAKLPSGIRSWSKHSWKKQFFLYLNEKQKFFAYPYVSFSMNLNEPGTNVTSKDFKFLNSLEFTSDISNLTLDNDAPRYDMAYMLLPKSLNFFNPALKNYDYVVDFFGSQWESYDDDQWLITALEVSQYEKSYGLELKPIELNIIFGIKGETLFLTQKKHIKTTRLSRSLINYYYPVPEWYFPFFQAPLSKRLSSTLLFYFKKLFGIK